MMQKLMQLLEEGLNSKMDSFFCHFSNTVFFSLQIQ